MSDEVLREIDKLTDIHRSQHGQHGCAGEFEALARIAREEHERVRKVLDELTMTQGIAEARRERAEKAEAERADLVMRAEYAEAERDEARAALRGGKE